MTKFQKIMVILTSVIVVVVCGIAGLFVFEEVQPTREEQLASACAAHPGECDKMRAVHAATDVAARQAEQIGPLAASSLASLKQTQQDYDDRFIAEGYYGDKK